VALDGPAAGVLDGRCVSFPTSTSPFTLIRDLISILTNMRTFSPRTVLDSASTATTSSAGRATPCSAPWTPAAAATAARRSRPRPRSRPWPARRSRLSRRRRRDVS
jgi:hypothetical protein